MSKKTVLCDHDQHSLSPEKVKERHEFIEQSLQLARGDRWSEFIDYLMDAVTRGYSTMVMFD